MQSANIRSVASLSPARLSPNGFAGATRSFCQNHPMVLPKGRRPNRKTTQCFLRNHRVVPLKPLGGNGLALGMHMRPSMGSYPMDATPASPPTLPTTTLVGSTTAKTNEVRKTEHFRAQNEKTCNLNKVYNTRASVGRST